MSELEQRVAKLEAAMLDTLKKLNRALAVLEKVLLASKSNGAE